MSENTLEQAAADILTSALETVGAAKDFVMAELPDVVQQLLLWKMVESLVWFGVGFVALLAVVWWWFYIARQKWARDYDGDLDPGVVVPSGFISLVLLTIAAAMTLGNLTWLQILIAPKVYLIEYASKMVSG